MTKMKCPYLLFSLQSIAKYRNSIFFFKLSLNLKFKLDILITLFTLDQNTKLVI